MRVSTAPTARSSKSGIRTAARMRRISGQRHGEASCVNEAYAAIRTAEHRTAYDQASRPSGAGSSGISAMLHDQRSTYRRILDVMLKPGGAVDLVLPQICRGRDGVGGKVVAAGADRVAGDLSTWPRSFCSARAWPSQEKVEDARFRRHENVANQLRCVGPQDAGGAHEQRRRPAARAAHRERSPGLLAEPIRNVIDE
eukprot:scaffold2159_cov170-Pinguiococcus_pyrenoidosus.AAC.3